MSAPAAASTVSTAQTKPKPTLPLAYYFSSLGYLTFLLISSFLFLPRSTLYFLPASLRDAYLSPPIQRSSADRPEHPFLTPLTSNPLMTMGWEVAGAGIVIAWWAAKLGKSWIAAGIVKASALGLKRSREAALATLGTSIFITPLIIALGAPLHEYIFRTFLFALHLSIILVWPVIYILGIPSIYDAGLYDRYRLSKLLCELRADNPLERTLVYPFIGTLVGAWLGVFPIPLDWDRPWQSWPLTPTVGSIVGFILGNYASFAHSAIESLQRDVAVDQQKQQTAVASKSKKNSKLKKGKTA